MNTLVYTVQIMNNKQKEDATTLEILQAIEGNRDITQRHLADTLNVALGLANSYLKRCVRKGLVKIHQAPANRYLYYLTPSGFAEKSRLTAQYLSHSFDFYRKASSSIHSVYQLCESNGWKKILLCGISELAEIASLREHEYQVQIVGVFEPDTKIQNFLNFQVWSDLDHCNSFDVLVLTALNEPLHIYEILLEREDAGRILIPEILGIRQ